MRSTRDLSQQIPSRKSSGMSECHYSQTYSCPVFRGFSTGTEQRAGRKNKWDVHGKRKKLRKTWRRGARERRRNSEEEGKQAGRGSERPWDLVRFVEHSLGGGSSMADRSTPTPHLSPHPSTHHLLVQGYTLIPHSISQTRCSSELRRRPNFLLLLGQPP